MADLKLVTILSSIFFLAATSTRVAATDTGNKYRLPGDLEPIHYELWYNFHIYRRQYTQLYYAAHTCMYFKTLKPTNVITLHNVDITVHKITVEKKNDGTTYDVNQTRNDRETEMMYITVDRQLPVGQEFCVCTDFNGDLTNYTQRGFFFIPYQKPDWGLRYMVMTKFKSTFARYAFPCMDEPHLKATFTVKLLRSNYGLYTVLSNMPLLLRQYVASRRGMLMKFRETPRMSTYNVGWMITDTMVSIKGHTKDGTEVTVYTTSLHTNGMNYFRDTAIKYLDFLIESFKSTLPWKKISIVGVPDFEEDVVGQWGLIYVDDSMLFLDKGDISFANKFMVDHILSRGLAQMWLGNKLTHKWWDEVWITEGLAYLMSYEAMDRVRPEWRVYDMFPTFVTHVAMRRDELHTSRPLVTPVSTPLEIFNHNDFFVRLKGAALFRMLSDYIARGNLTDVLARLVAVTKDKSATAQDVFDAFEAHMLVATHHQPGADTKIDMSLAQLRQSFNINGVTMSFNVTEFMMPWLLQKNYPVVTLNKNRNLLTVNQTRFLKDPGEQDTSNYTAPFGYQWQIPFSYVTSSSPQSGFNRIMYQTMHFTGTTSTDLRISHSPGWLESTTWIVGNVQETGYYRVQYATDDWHALVVRLNDNPKSLTAVTRAQLINDAWTLALADYVNVSVAMDTFNYLPMEMDYIAWRAVLYHTNTLLQMLGGGSLREKFNNYMRSRVRNFYMLSRSAYEIMDNNMYLLNKVQMDEIACNVGLSNCIIPMLSSFREWRSNNFTSESNPFEKQDRASSYCYVMRMAKLAMWKKFFKAFKTQKNSKTKEEMRHGLTCTKLAEALNRLLKGALNRNVMSRTMGLRTVTEVINNGYGTQTAWAFIRLKWGRVNRRFTFDYGISKVVQALGQNLKTAADHALMEQQKKTHVEQYYGDGDLFNEALENIKFNIHWVGKVFPAIERAINDGASGHGPSYTT